MKSKHTQFEKWVDLFKQQELLTVRLDIYAHYLILTLSQALTCEAETLNYSMADGLQTAFTDYFSSVEPIIGSGGTIETHKGGVGRCRPFVQQSTHQPV